MLIDENFMDSILAAAEETVERFREIKDYNTLKGIEKKY
jgi:hypothetical protein